MNNGPVAFSQQALKIAISWAVGAKNYNNMSFRAMPQHGVGIPRLGQKNVENQVETLGDCHGFLRNPRNDSTNQLLDKREFDTGEWQQKMTVPTGRSFLFSQN